MLKQLALRFGVLPVAAEALIRAAEGEELDGIAARLLSARTLNEALGRG